MEPVDTDTSEDQPDAPIENPFKKALKIVLGLSVALAVLLLFGMAISPPNNYTGGGVVKVAAPVSSTCLITVAQDDGEETTYTKLGAPSCFGYFLGKRVEIIEGKIS